MAACLGFSDGVGRTPFGHVCRIMAKPRKDFLCMRAELHRSVLAAAFGRSTAERQQVLADGCGTGFLNQQRACVPCSPGFTWVHAAHFAGRLSRRCREASPPVGMWHGP